MALLFSHPIPPLICTSHLQSSINLQPKANKSSLKLITQLCRASTSSLRRHYTPLQNSQPNIQFHQINSLCQEGRLTEALRILNENAPIAGTAGLSSLADAIGCVIQACGQHKDLDTGKELHELILSQEGLRCNVVLNTRLVTMYSICGCPENSRRVFDEFRDKNLFLWNALISGYVRNEMWEEAYSVYSDLLEITEFWPDNFTLPCLIKASAGILCVELGREVHGRAMKLGLHSDVFVCNALMAMYAKCGCLDDAVQVFDKMTERNMVSWNTLAFGFAQNGCASDCYEVFIGMMSEDGLQPDVATVVTVLPVCAVEGNVEMGRVVHGLAVKLGLNEEITVNNTLIDMYGKSDCLDEAAMLFDESMERNVVTWNSMISSCSRNGDVYGSFALLREMANEGMIVNSVTVLNVLPACLEPPNLLKLTEIHGYAIRNGIESEKLVANMLVAAYAKCGDLESAERFFYDISVKGINSWNAIVGGHAQNGDAEKAFHLFREMQSTTYLDPDPYTIGSLILAAARLAELSRGKEIHGFAIRNGFKTDSFIGISLLSLYIKCRLAMKAHHVFSTMKERNVVSWNAMISGFAQNGCPNETLALFRQMVEDSAVKDEPKDIASMAALSASAQLPSLQLGKALHCFVVKRGLTDNLLIGSSIIDMYVKVGCLTLARSFFNRMSEKDIVHWNVMISGYGIHGQGRETIALYEQMKSKGFSPDSLTLIGVLTACSHGGLLEDGRCVFDEAQKKYNIKLTVEHYACMVDMLGRAGRLNEAYDLVMKMPIPPDAVVWSALLGACRVHGSDHLAETAAEKLIELDPNSAGNYVMLSNVYAASGRWDDVRRVRNKIKELGLKKPAGCSWIEIRGKVFEFVSGDRRHAEYDDIERKWSELEMKIRELGYVSDTKLVLHDIDEEEKVQVLSGHSEKLAIAYGLMNMPPGTTLRVTKNLRMCGDCHSAAKLVSVVVGVDIVVRDNRRFHHFEEGVCSCGDYW